MKRLTMAAVAVAMFSLPALAEQPTGANQIDPAKKGPTDSVTEQVPPMKTAPGDAANSPQHPATKNVGDAVPPMHPNDEASPSNKEPTTMQQSEGDAGAAQQPAKKLN